MRQNIVIGLLIFSLLGIVMIKIDGLMTLDPAEPQWQLTYRSDYPRSLNIVVEDGRVGFVDNRGRIHEYEGEIIVSQRPNYVVVCTFHNNHPKSVAAHGYTKYKVYVPK